ncbi:zinc ribbon domain-containing protein [Sharpea azabuensis]|uniref:zinc ribbon domain-containing protein n=1 Tax=Sharpea azabuensis TaxID=322505 RepID=UPI0008F44832|nr:zinc ribbon domain-containing protein [Sharpea azabuensis]HAJ15032.1 zinc ribbon domain-containing protein [Erysipelotrichaceae bacterium]MEE3307747.1 zinc ribbon domain-containing protein [Sharpea azabuensis]SFD67091.1 zinc-ribbon domain-containing protein [Sharpea azabuensis]SFK64104.1 zinc-ribbon domain-containing protein [Sharpea azabuensis]HAV18159.1 zinc ribbon domain-containing protein [Erysipelotrichaceae bacterium]
MYCTYCGKQISEDAKFCPYCGQKVPDDYQGETINNDGPSYMFQLIGFLFPIIGFVLYAFYYKKSPLKARSAGIGGLMGLIVNIVLLVLGNMVFGLY